MTEQDTALRAGAKGRTAEHAESYYVRFAVAQRVEHIVLLISFSLLGLTGLIQKYAGNGIAEWLIQALGGIERVRTIHHASAIVFVLLAIYHLVVLIYKVFVLHSELSMLPGMKDVTDLIGLVRYNLGLSKRRPALPRYSFDEKVEYWALIWGTVIMAITGFMLWNPILVAKYFPGQLIPAAKAAHGAEAVLAVLAIIVWHFYNVHVKTFNKSMFTGKMSEGHMAEEHGEELAAIKAGQARPRPSPAVIRQRARVVMPAAIIGAVLMTGAIFWLATAEKTAITTVPTPAIKVFVPLPPTPTPTAATAQIGKPIPHDTAGKEQCDTCHGPNGVKPYPADHAGRPNVSCLICHQAAPQALGAGGAGAGAVAAAIPHPVEGRQDCLMCHKAGGLNPVPASHAGRTNDACQACHKLDSGITGTPAAPAAAAASPAAAGPAATPHDVAGRTQCDACHGQSGLKPYPQDHAGRANATCTTCHKPATTGAAAAGAATGSATPAATAAAEEKPAAAASPAVSGPPAVPHDLAGRAQCDTCHGLTGLKPYPQDHVGRSDDNCTLCHKPASAASAAAATPAAGTATPVGSATPTATAAALATPAAAAPASPAAGGPPAIPHDLTGRAECDMCHGASGVKPYPQDHAGRSNDNCTLCHKPAAAATAATPAAGETPAAAASPAAAAGPVAIPHDLTGKLQCDMCHGSSGVKPYPQDHAGRSNDSCTACHKPAA